MSQETITFSVAELKGIIKNTKIAHTFEDDVLKKEYLKGAGDMLTKLIEIKTK